MDRLQKAGDSPDACFYCRCLIDFAVTSDFARPTGVQEEHEYYGLALTK